MMKAPLQLFGTAFVVILLCSCHRPTRPTGSFEQLNSVKARSAPLWMPTLTGYQLTVSNTLTQLATLCSRLKLRA
jgi:hypothetical protein